MALGRAGSVPGAIGVRMAFEPGHGRTAVPVRSALAAITVAVVAVTAAGVFGSSLIRLVDVPHRYGRNWNTELDLAFGAAPKSLLARLVSAQPGVTGYADGDYGEVTVKGQTVSAIGLTPAQGQGYLTLLAGHPPDGPGQIVLGARTLRSLHLRIGQTVRVTANAFGVVSRAVRPMRIVGEAVFAELAGEAPSPAPIWATAHWWRRRCCPPRSRRRAAQPPALTSCFSGTVRASAPALPRPG